MNESRSDRAKRQAHRQSEYRIKQKTQRKPSRDDVARITLRLIITDAIRLKQHDQLINWSTIMVKRLVRQGFDEAQSWKRVDELINRYEDGWTFRRKVHLENATEE